MSLHTRNHDLHWSALLGFDWMLETPSLIVHEIDESDFVECLQGFDHLLSKSGTLELHSVLLNNQLLTTFPKHTQAYPSDGNFKEFSPWNSEKIEQRALISWENGFELMTYCSDAFWNYSLYSSFPKVGLSAFIYTIRPEQSSATLTPLSNKKDGLTSYSFSGTTLSEIESVESFYHKGWIANMEILLPNYVLLNIRIWIHRKNAATPPEEGILYSGELWLHSSATLNR